MKLSEQLAECQRERDFERKEKENAFRLLDGVTDTCKKLELAAEYKRGRKDQAKEDALIALRATVNHSYAVCHAGELIAKAIREQEIN